MARKEHASDQAKRPKKPKPQNAIGTALSEWFTSLPDDLLGGCDVQALIIQAPKRWSVYEPMVLLPEGSFTSDAWKLLFAQISDGTLDDLWRLIIAHIPPPSRHSKLTHLAANEGIPLHSSEGAEENILRSPIGLRTLHGDFGPSTLLDAEKGVTIQDLEQAFWVHTKQNGIYQTWAPRWTMFSRGNVKEKARVLDFHKPSPARGFQHRVMSKKELENRWAVDLYAGIGYFTFSYAKIGLHVLCWELNPWSVAGLARAAPHNGVGFSCRIIEGTELKTFDMRTILEQPTNITVFVEDNVNAKWRIELLRSLAQEVESNDPVNLSNHHGVMGKVDGSEHGNSANPVFGLGGGPVDGMNRARGLKEVDILHINCGFLPTSEPTWQNAWDLVRKGEKSWLHLHENVGVDDIEKRKAEICRLFENFCSLDGLRQHIKVEHVERVKTFAPGVWHCVFDVYITG